MREQESELLHRRPLRDDVYDSLHRSILAGQYAAGAWLRQEEIAARLGVSMTPVREALDLLVSSGLAERVPYRGVRVLRPSSAEILDSYAMRLLLEGAAAYAAASRISADELYTVHQLLEEAKTLVGLEDMPKERAASRALHSAIVAASGNALLHRLYLTVLNTFPDWLLYEHLYRQPDLLEESMLREHEEHAQIVQALSNHDPDLAVQRSMEHVAHRGRELEKYLGISPEALQARETHIRRLLSGALADTGQRERVLP